MVRLEIPGDLRFRALVVRTMAAACRVARERRTIESDAEEPELDLSDEFDAQMVSALSEAFNNIVIHAYADGASGDVIIEADVVADTMHVRLMDFGSSMAPDFIPPPPARLPENGMGLFIVRAFVDEFDYTAGTPNVWSLKKALPAAA